MNQFKELMEDFLIFFKWLLFAFLVGSIVGIVGVAFHISIEIATELRIEHDWLIFFLPLGGIIIAALYKLAHMEKDGGTNFVLASVRSSERITVKTAPLIFISTVLTHLMGGSSGREGAALQIGGSISSKIGTYLHLDSQDTKIITICGMSAAFASLFGTPITAVIFCMEVVHVGMMHYSAMVPCTIAAITGVSIAKFFKVAPTHFDVSGIPLPSVNTVIQVLILAMLCALVSISFCKITKSVSMLYKKYIPNRYMSAVAGGIIIIAITYLSGTRDYNGAGMEVITRAINGEANTEAFLLKMIFTAFTLGAGFKGGEIVPAFFTGATFGNVAGDMIGLDPSFGAAIGLVAVFCGVTNCPLASIILSIEIFGIEGLIFYAIACATSYMLSGYFGLYSEQQLLYSKTRPERIDIKAK